MAVKTKSIELNMNKSLIKRDILNSLGNSAEGLTDIKTNRKMVARIGIIKYIKKEIPSIRKIFVEVFDSLNSLNIIITEIMLTHKTNKRINGGNAERL